MNVLAKPLRLQAVLLFVLLAMASGCRTAGVSEASSVSAGRLQLPLTAFQQTTDYTCGPACLVTIARYYGIRADEMHVAQEANCSAETGTTPQNMARWLDLHGFDVKWGENGSLDALRANLARGVPTLVEWIDWGGHWVIVVGYDTRNTPTPDDDLLIFADPSDCTDGKVDGLTTFNAGRFDSMWFDAFLFGKPMHRIFITAVPRRRSNESTAPAH